MIEKIIARWIRSRILSEETENYSMRNTGYRLFNSWLLGGWFGIGLLLSYIAYGYGLDSFQCYLCNRVVQIIPTIDIASGRSDFPNVMRIIWLYLTITTPLITLALLASTPFISFYYAPQVSIKMVVFSWLFCFVIFVLCFTFVFEWGGVDGNTRNGKFFAHTIFGGYFFSFAFFSGGPIILWLSVINSIYYFLNK